MMQKEIIESGPGAEFWTERFVVPGNVDVQLTPQLVPKFKLFLENNGLVYNVVHQDLQQDIDNLFLRNQDAYQGGDFFSAYANFYEMQAFLRFLHGNYTTMSSIVKVGTTLEGRDITGIVITGAGSQNKSKIVINGCQHARYVIFYFFLELKNISSWMI